MRSSQVTDRGVWLWFVMARGSWHAAARDFFARLHIDTLSLIIPIGSLVDGPHFRQRERNAAEAVRALPLHLGRADHFVLRARTMQVDQPVRHEVERFAILSVVIDERLLCRRVPCCLPLVAPDYCLQAGRRRTGPLESEVSGDLLQSVRARREIDLGVDERE